MHKMEARSDGAFGALISTQKKVCGEVIDTLSGQKKINKERRLSILFNHPAQFPIEKTTKVSGSCHILSIYYKFLLIKVRIKCI